MQPVARARNAAGFRDRRDQFQVPYFKVHIGLPSR
jgi:hypothetical protein